MGVIFLVSFFGVAYSWVKSTDKKLATAASVFYINIICLVWITFIIFIAINFIPEGVPDIAFYIGFQILGVVLIFICFALVFPRNNKITPLTINQKKAITAILICIPVILFPMGDFLTSLALKTAKLGGDFKATISIYEKVMPKMPKEIQSEKLPLTSKPLYFVLDVGKRTYVSLEKDKKDRKIIAIDNKMISQINYL